jgi:hypothetical protein
MVQGKKSVCSNNVVIVFVQLGRLRRRNFPRLSRGGQQAAWAVSAARGGRLFCDTAQSSKELIRETSYDLSRLSQSLLNIRSDSSI